MGTNTTGKCYEQRMGDWEMDVTDPLSQFYEPLGERIFGYIFLPFGLVGLCVDKVGDWMGSALRVTGADRLVDSLDEVLGDAIDYHFDDELSDVIS